MSARYLWHTSDVGRTRANAGERVRTQGAPTHALVVQRACSYRSGDVVTADFAAYWDEGKPTCTLPSLPPIGPALPWDAPGVWAIWLGLVGFFGLLYWAMLVNRS